MQARSTASSAVPESVQRKLARYAEGTARAIVIGDRNGFIEWTNDAWSRVTGYALEESVGKPIASFVQQVDLDPTLVHFIASSFSAGEVCALEVPFQAPDGTAMRVHLRVEPLRGPDGEVSDFVAVASDASDDHEAPAVEAVDLTATAGRVCHILRPRLGPRAQLDVDIEPGLPLAGGNADQVWALASRAAERAAMDLGDDWGTITVGIGVLGRGEGPLYPGDLRDLRDRAGLPPGHYGYLEIHDSGPETGAARDAERPDLFAANGHERAMGVAAADRELRASGGRVLAASELWCGTSVLFVLPLASAGALSTA